MQADLSSPARPVNRASRGPLVQANSQNGIAIFTGYDLNPGDSRIATVRIANPDGTVARLRLEESAASSDFGAELTLVIEDISGAPRTLYSGAIGEVPAGGIELGAFAPGEERTYRLAAKLAADADRSNDRGAGALYEWSEAPGPVA